MTDFLFALLLAATQEPQVSGSAWRTLPTVTGPGRYCTPNGWSVELGERDTASTRMALIDEDRTEIRIRFVLAGRRIEAEEGDGPLSEAPRPGVKIATFHTPPPNGREYMAVWEVPMPGGVEYRRLRSGDFNFGDYLVLRSAAFRGGGDDRWFLDRFHPYHSREEQCMEGTRTGDYPEFDD